MNRIIAINKPESLSEISRDIAQVFFAGMAVGPLIDKELDLQTILIGLILSVCFWSISLGIANKGEKMINYTNIMINVYIIGAILLIVLTLLAIRIKKDEILNK